jgi:hypothetical protein
MLEIQFPLVEEPQWKNIIPRWNQLDPYASAMAQGAWAWKEKLSPSFIILASPKASNETDLDFYSSGATSPAKFAYTLPNIRASSFCQILPWTGPMLCVQRDPETVVQGLTEGAWLLGKDFSKVLILTVVKSVNCYKVYGFELGSDDDDFILDWSESGAQKNDSIVLDWFEKNERELEFSNFKISRKG